MKILLTGGSGFLGGNFIEKYGKKYDIVAPSSAEINLLRVEPIYRLTRKHNFAAVVHLAGKADGRTGTALEADNLIMFKNLQYAATLSGIKKLLVIGDASDFDISTPVIKVSENEFGDTLPTDGYGLGRYLIHLLASKDKISTVLRFFSIYGKGADVGTNKLMEMCARGITGSKDLAFSRDKILSTVFVDDACKIIAAFLDNEFPKGDYNIAQDAFVSYGEIAKKVKAYAKKNGRDINIVCKYTEYDPELTANTDKLKMVLPTFKFVPLTSGLNKTLEYLQSHKSQCRPKRPKKLVDTTPNLLK